MLQDQSFVSRFPQTLSRNTPVLSLKERLDLLENDLKAKKAVAPVWVVVTSQEKLDEVVAALDSKRVELAKLQDRFRYRIDLAPADIREVATRRVLGKKENG